MKCDEENNSGVASGTACVDDDSRSAVNSLILDYYKKFGRKRDLEQYFSLSTAQSDIRDTSGVFWRKMKTQNDSSDSERKSDSPQELCRISIRCSAPDPCSSQDETNKSESVSPPIITEELASGITRHTDDELGKSDDNHSQKSLDVLLDTSTNKAISPSSSITCQRKLEWDSLADVGYSYESDRKTSASSLSTLEKLALKQQYSNNDTKQDSNIGHPTAHSTPLDENDTKPKGKKGLVKKTTRFYKKNVDFVEVNVPHDSDMNASHAISLNLSKHISFNVEKDGVFTVEHIKKDVSVSPEKVSEVIEVTPNIKMDKEIQTSLNRVEQSNVSSAVPKTVQMPIQKIPVLFSLKTLKKRNKKKKLKMVRRKIKKYKRVNTDKENVTLQEKNGEHLSEAESFEYLPGHMYNQNQMVTSQPPPVNIAGNKSSLESSGALTTDSSKGSKHSFTQDLEKSIDLLKAALHKRYNDSNLRNKLIKEVCHRLLQSKYRDDESTTDFLSGLSFSSKKLGLGNDGHTTTSTSDANNSGEKPKLTRPKKSILRVDKFNANVIASTSQSTPNLPAATNNEKLITSDLIKPLQSSNTESDSSKGKTSSDGAFVKTSSEEFYQKYLEALKREEAYKKHLKIKEMFLKQKLVSSDNAFKVPVAVDTKVNNKLKDLIKDLTRNNYDDGSGDASKLEGASNSNIAFQRYNPARNQRSHSVFTLSSGNSDCQNKKLNLKKRIQHNLKDLSKPGPSKEGTHYCCCPHHSIKSKFGVTDSSVQVNIKHQYEEELSTEEQRKYTDITTSRDRQRSVKESPKNVARVMSDKETGDIKYVCLCNEKPMSLQEVPENFLIYKCSRLTDKIIQIADNPSRGVSVQCAADSEFTKNRCEQYLQSSSKDLASQTDSKELDIIKRDDKEENNEINRVSKSSQTNLALNMLHRRSSDKRMTSSSTEAKKNSDTYLQRDLENTALSGQFNSKKNFIVSEATRSIQTEISIDPKISDPCLSDINIINDGDCAKLISERNKGTLKPNIVIYKCQDQCNIEVDTDSGSGKTFAISDTKSGVEPYEKEVNCCGLPFLTQTADNNIQLDVNKINDNVSQTNNMQQTETLADNFTIPIQGTNMTLMVSIGSKAQDIVKKFDEGVATDKANFAEHATSVIDECSKGVQYENVVDTVNLRHNKDSNYNNMNVSQDREQVFSKTCCLVNTSVTTKEPKFHTYPKDVQVNARKPFLRSNTDTGRFDKCHYIQTDYINQKDMQTQQSFLSLDSQICTIPVTEKHQKSCSCPDKTAKCVGRCEHIDGSNIDQCIKISHEHKKDMGTQKDLLKESFQTSGTILDKKNIESKPMHSLECQGQGTCEEQKGCKMGCRCQTNDQTNKTQQYLLINQPQSSKVIKTVYSIDKMKSTTDPNLQEPIQTYDRLEEQTDNVLSDSINKSQKSTTDSEKHIEFVRSSDPILDMIQNITKRYSKKDIEKNKKKKCFKEIMTVLNYLLETDECTDLQSEDQAKASCTSTTEDSRCNIKKKPQIFLGSEESKKFVDKGIQLPLKKSKSKLCNTESSDLPASTDLPGTSSESATCKVLNKIKKECERYHQKRCKCSHGGKKCEASSSTSVTCEQCRRVHHCTCRAHKCKGHRLKSTTDKIQKKSVAYNLIIQTSESMISEETLYDKYSRPLQNIIVKVPSRRKQVDNVPFKEISAKIERDMPHCSPRCDSKMRSKSLPNESEISSSEDLLRRAQACTVREYLEINRPDFVKKSSQRQNCLKLVSESRNEDLCASPCYKMVVVQTPHCMEPFNNICNRGVPLCCNSCINPYLQTVQSEVTRLGASYVNHDNAALTTVLKPEGFILSLPLKGLKKANERAAQRDLLSLHVEQLPTLTALSPEDLRHLAREIGADLRRKKLSPKIISEREMKKHSEKIYKTLPEVVRKKEDIRKENIKKTNILMANIFKKNLQKKALRGSVNLSNYSTVIKI